MTRRAHFEESIDNSTVRDNWKPGKYYNMIHVDMEGLRRNKNQSIALWSTVPNSRQYTNIIYQSQWIMVNMIFPSHMPVQIYTSKFTGKNCLWACRL